MERIIPPTGDRGATASSIASDLAARMNGTLVTANANPCVPVTAQCGAIISLQANAAGASTNYTLTASSSSTLGSFAAAASGASLTGGADAIPATPAQTVWSGVWITQYKFDALGNLYCVEQHGDATGTPCPTVPFSPTAAPIPPDTTNPWRLRRFGYNSLGQLLWASNPESGIIQYAYDPNGNLVQKTSPAPNQTGTATQTVSYCNYDPLNRVLAKGYGAQACSSPVVSYSYDSGLNGIGHLTSMIDQAGTVADTYDVMGHLKSETRSILGVPKSTTYLYDLNGALTKLTYPSNRVVDYTSDSAGRLVTAVDENGTGYVVSSSHNPDGSLKGMVYGSIPNLTSSFQYTSRLQLCRMTTITAGTLPSSCGDTNIGNVMDRGYNFNSVLGNNGNVMSIINYRDATRSQAFTYDSLNRITSGSSSANTGAFSWGEDYSIDEWGNLQISPMANKEHGGNFTHSGTVQNQAAGLGYDAAGNLTNYTSPGQYVYDQENRLSSTAGMTYTYDGNGERVLKSDTSTGAAVKRYWSMGGNTLAEADSSGNLTAEYIYVGGKRIARVDLPANTVHYYLSDRLGSTSIIANVAGTVEEESDYYPFGTEVVVTGPGTNELKFTGKRRDTESHLDYFGARYYSNGLGRFITPDWAEKATAVPYADLDDPQSLNLYSYVRNGPLFTADIDGHCFPLCDFINVVTSFFVTHPNAAAKVEAAGKAVQKVAAEHPRTTEALKGAGKVLGGAATVATSATAEVGSGGLATVPVIFGVMGGSAMFVSGVTDIMGAVTNTNVSQADKALSAVSNPAGLVTTAVTGNIDKGSQASAIGDLAVASGDPAELLKGSTTDVVIKTGLAAQSLIEGVTTVKEVITPPPNEKKE
jgi:RHS repeat-associated protein